MIQIKITKEEIILAKKITKQFDKQKTYNKYKCNTNYRGVLGEMVFDSYLTYHNVKHKWVNFIKPDWNQPDFILKGINIDLKTTVGKQMWITKPKHDLYIYAQISNDDKTMIIKSYTTKSLIQQAIKQGKTALTPEEMIPISTLNVK